jgi:hypothetical protein
MLTVTDIRQKQKAKNYVQRKGWDFLLFTALEEINVPPGVANHFEFNRGPYFRNPSARYWLEDPELEEDWNIGFKNIVIEKALLHYGDYNQPTDFFCASFNEIDFKIGVHYISPPENVYVDCLLCVVLVIDGEVVLSMKYWQHRWSSCGHSGDSWNVIEVAEMKKCSKISKLLNSIYDAIQRRERFLREYQKINFPLEMQGVHVKKFSLKNYEFDENSTSKIRKIIKYLFEENSKSNAPEVRKIINYFFVSGLISGIILLLAFVGIINLLALT